MKKLSTIKLAALAFFIVSGGPYGLEEVVSSLGFRLALVAITVVPLLWALPIALLVGELASSLPYKSGYYGWVKEGCGAFPASLVAWSALMMSFFDMAIYPTLFVTYLSKLVPTLADVSLLSPGWVCGVMMMALCATVCMAGVRVSGTLSVIIAIALLSPFFVMLPISAAGAGGAPPAPPASFSGAVLLCMWNYMGWDNASTLASEVEDPQRSYPRAMALAIGATALCYIVAILCVSHMDTSGLTVGGWVDVARSLGGDGLGSFVAAAGCVCGAWMFCSLVTSYAQLPSAMARDGLIPSVFSIENSLGVPYVSVIVSCVAYAASLTFGLKRLIEIDVMLYGVVYALQFAALVCIRKKAPRVAGAFRVPLGNAGLAIVGLAPACTLCYAMWVARDELGVWSLSSAQLGAIVIALCCLLASISIIKRGEKCL